MNKNLSDFHCDYVFITTSGRIHSVNHFCAKTRLMCVSNLGKVVSYVNIRMTVKVEEEQEIEEKAKKTRSCILKYLTR
jgi:hypothetical protein